MSKCWCGGESLNSWGECLEHTIMGSDPKSPMMREDNQMADLAPIPHLRNLISHIPRFLNLQRSSTQDTTGEEVTLQDNS